MRRPLSRPLLGATALVAAAAALGPLGAVPAQAAGPDTEVAAASATGPVGGPLLTRHGTVVHRAPHVPKPPRVRASAWLVADTDSGAVLAAKDAHGAYRPASTLKILTAVALIPRLAPGEHVRPTRDDCAVDGSKVGIVAGMRYRVDDLFRGMLLSSGNDAALALARAADGRRHTLALMNETARHLQAYDTVARTPNGLDAPGQRTSVYDLALITRAGLQMPRFRRYVSTVRATFPAPHHKAFAIQNHNRLLTTYDGAIGVKTGYTTKALGTYVGAAHRGHHTIVVVLLHARPDYWPSVRKLLTWGFLADGKVRPVGTLVAPLAAQGETPTPAAASPPAGDASVTAVRAAATAPAGESGFDTVTATLAATLIAVTLTGLVAVGVLRRQAPHALDRRRHAALPGQGWRSRRRRRG